MSAMDRFEQVMEFVVGRDPGLLRPLFGITVMCVVLCGAVVGIAFGCEALAPCTAKEPGQCPMFCTGYKGQQYICGWRDCEECTARRWYWEPEPGGTP